VLSQVDIVNPAGSTLALSLTDSSGGYSVRDIGGLGPVKAAVTSTSYAVIDGAKPQSTRRDIRNITAKIGIEPNYSTNTMRGLRNDLYKYLMPKMSIGLKFYFDGTLYALTNGTVESLDPTLFSQDQELALSVICFDPDFYAPAATTVTGATVTDSTTTSIDYPGNSDAGVVFTLNVNATMSDGFALYNTRPDTTIQVFSTTASLLADDVVTISSVPGNKYIQLNRSGTISSLLYSVDSGSTWPSLEQGANLFRAYSSVGDVPFSMDFTPKYGAL
jgi:hypothetical protein